MVVRYKSARSLKEHVCQLIEVGDLDQALRLIHGFVERIITEPLCTSQVFGSKDLESSCQRIGSKPIAVDEVQGQYMGLLPFTPEGWSELIRIRSWLSSIDCDKMHMAGTLQRVIEAGQLPIVAVPYQGEWGEVDSAEDLGVIKTKVYFNC